MFRKDYLYNIKLVVTYYVKMCVVCGGVVQSLGIVFFYNFMIIVKWRKVPLLPNGDYVFYSVVVLLFICTSNIPHIIKDKSSEGSSAQVKFC